MVTTSLLTTTLAPTTIITTQNATDPIETTKPTTSTTESTTSAKMTYSTKAINIDDDPDGNIGLIIGCVVGAVVLVAIVGLVAGFLLYRRRRRKRKKNKPLPVAPHKDELDRPHIDGIVYHPAEETTSGTGSNPYENLDVHGKPNDETNPELDSEGYLKKHTPLKKAVNKIKGKGKKRMKRNKHGYKEELSDISLPAYGNVGFGAEFNRAGVTSEMGGPTAEDVQIKSSSELGYVDGRIAAVNPHPAYYYNTDGINAEKSTPRRTRRTMDNDSDRKTKQQNVETAKQTDTVDISPGGEVRQSYYENLPNKQKHSGFSRQISEEVYENS